MRIFRAACFSALILCLAAPVLCCAAENDPRNLSEQGRTLLEQKKFDEALPLLKSYHEQHPQDAQGTLDYAVALLFTGQPEASIPLLREAARMDPALEPGGLFFESLAWRKMDRRPEAAAAVLTLTLNHPDREATRNAIAASSALAGDALREADTLRQAAMPAVPARPTPAKPWSLFATIGMEHDTNVALIPDATATLPEEISSRSASRAAYALGGAYRFYQAGGHEAGVHVSYSGTEHRHLGDFDVDSVYAGIPWSYTQGALQFRLSPSVSHTWVKGDRHSWNWGMGPGVSWRPLAWTWTDFDYSYGQTRYYNDPVLAEENRDADTHWFGVRQNVSFPGLFARGLDTFFSLTLLYSTNNASGSSYDHDATGGTLLFQQEFPWDLSFQASVTYRDISYDHPNVRSPIGEARSDDETTWNLKLFKRITDSLSAYAGYRHYDNRSNLGTFYSYASEVWSIGLRFDL